MKVEANLRVLDVLQKDTYQRLHKVQMTLKDHLHLSRAKVVTRTEHERHIDSVIDFCGEELSRVENEFRKFVTGWGKNFNVENAKAENMWFTKGNGEVVGDNPLLRSRELSPEECEEEVESLISRSRCHSRQASQQGVELTSARDRITELEEEGKNVKDLQFQVNVLEVEVADTRARASKYEVLWLVADVLIKKMEEARNRQNENKNAAWNKVVTLEHTIQGFKLNILEHLDENTNLRYANMKLDVDLL
ncbi:hypothetical protein GIB67_040972 [Kingdonia uniflora]|uniref:Uncharacterized protein n=1 Tax=Kingdonia uniflora TaxID=39325 RepID=A0A7J7NCI5_9MAGN|nr:hypothetical protein GIB67_040972 [Kingdonia uniflora]